MRGGGFKRYIGQGPGDPRRRCEYLNGLIALAIDVVFKFLSFCFWYFQLFLVYIVIRKIIM